MTAVCPSALCVVCSFVWFWVAYVFFFLTNFFFVNVLLIRGELNLRLRNAFPYYPASHQMYYCTTFKKNCSLFSLVALSCEQRDVAFHIVKRQPPTILCFEMLCVVCQCVGVEMTGTVTVVLLCWCSWSEVNPSERLRDWVTWQEEGPHIKELCVCLSPVCHLESANYLGETIVNQENCSYSTIWVLSYKHVCSFACYEFHVVQKLFPSCQRTSWIIFLLRLTYFQRVSRSKVLQIRP